MTRDILEIDGLDVTFRVPDLTGRTSRLVHAVRGVSLRIAPGETLGVVGESGSGKSTVARAVVGLSPVSGGRIRIDGQTLPARPGAAARHGVQMVFQDHASTLNPFQPVSRILDDVLALARPGLTRPARAQAAAELLEQVGLGPEALDRRASSFSGGQRQRISIARGLCGDPKLLLCDEPTSALDVSIQAQILELLAGLKRRGLAIVLISHNLAVVRQVSDRIAVMYAGRVLEEGPAAGLVGTPAHPYTRALIDAAPTLAGRGSLLQRMRGKAAAPLPPQIPPGTDPCPWLDRCPRRVPACASLPQMLPAGHGGGVRCHRPLGPED